MTEHSPTVKCLCTCHYGDLLDVCNGCDCIKPLAKPHPPTVKCKMMRDAGYEFPEPWDKYVLLVDFLKNMVNTRCIDLLRAQQILTEIGEWDESR